MVVGCCGKITKFNFTVLSLICVITSLFVAGIGAWLYLSGASFFGLGNLQFSVMLHLSGLVLGILGLIVLVLTLVSLAINSLESPIANIIVTM